MKREQIERAEKTLQRMLDWIARHDTRSAAVLGISLAMLGALSSSIPSPSHWTGLYGVMLTPRPWASVSCWPNSCVGSSPRFRATPSLFFFGTVAGLTLQEYQRQFGALDEDGYLEDLLTQCYTNSRILRSKFRSLKRSIIGLMFTALPWAAALGLGKGL